MRTLCVLAAAALALLAATAATASAPERVFRGPGIALRYPPGLYVTDRPLDRVTNPVQRFVLSTYRVPGGRPDASGAYTPPPDGVIATLLEDVPPGDPGFPAPPRPARFRLPALTNGLETFGRRFGELVFRDRGRDFYVFIGVGERASSSLVARVLDALDGVVIGPAPLSVRDA